jgi:integrase
MARASGLYCRVFVPADLRPHIGQRFLVRSLGSRDRDQARLIAAHYALAIGELFRQLRKELSLTGPKIDELIKTIQTGGTRDLTLRGLTAPDGTKVEEVIINNDEDVRLFREQFGGALAPAPAPPVQHFKVRRMEAHGTLTSVRSHQYDEYLKLTHSKYRAACTRSVQILIDLCGDLPPDDYTPEAIDELVKRMALLPLNPEKNKQYRDVWSKMNFEQLIRQSENLDVRRITDETVGMHIERLAGFFTFCKARRYMEFDSPLAARRSKVKIAKNQPKRLGFDDGDLIKIFDPELYKNRKLPHQFWPPLIALFTGARCNEIAQLYVDDIVQDQPQFAQAWRFMIRIGRPDQRLKNKYSVRSIPMHPRLMELGFLDYLNDVKALGFERVFPALRWTAAAGYGDTVSDMFSTYLRNKVKISDPKKVFHSFRHYFCDQANNLTHHDFARIYDITGHEREGEFHLSYARELHFATKLVILMDIPLPKMALPKYAAGMFTPYLQATKAKKASEAEQAKRPQIAKARKTTAAAKKKAGGMPVPAKRPLVKLTRARRKPPSNAPAPSDNHDK